MTRSLSRRLLVVSCGLIYFFLMLPLLVVFPISLSSAPYMQFPPPGPRAQIPGTGADRGIPNP